MFECFARKTLQDLMQNPGAIISSSSASNSIRPSRPLLPSSIVSSCSINAKLWRMVHTSSSSNKTVSMPNFGHISRVILSKNNQKWTHNGSTFILKLNAYLLASTFDCFGSSCALPPGRVSSSVASIGSSEPCSASTSDSSSA